MGSLIMRSRTMVFLCSTVLALAPAAAQERMYKCVDARGKVYYTQVPPPECLGRDTLSWESRGCLFPRARTRRPLLRRKRKGGKAGARKSSEEGKGPREGGGRTPRCLIPTRA